VTAYNPETKRSKRGLPERRECGIDPEPG
jgi:hypothetical protein